jgi:hypothetical protein
VAPFEERGLRVKDVKYSLFTLPGHDYFTRHFDAISDDLPKAITQLKDEFEVILGLDYPFERLALVEVPIHFRSHRRVWSATDETVQPQMVFLQEMGTLCDGADFAAYARWYRRWGKKGGKGGDVAPEEIQTMFFNGFIRTNLLGTQPEKGDSDIEGLSGVTESDVDAEYNLLPNYFSYTSSLASDRWPILHTALESWLQDRLSSSTFRFDRREGLTEQEKTNRLLDGRSLSELLADENLSDDDLQDIILAKGKYLMTALESRIQEDDFAEDLLDFIRRNSFNTITGDQFLRFLVSYREFDLEPVMAAWFEETRVSAFSVGAVEMSSVLSGEKKRTHIRIPITNISESEGIITVSVMTAQSKSKGYGSNMWETHSAVLFPPNTAKEIGILLDSPPVVLTLDTTISKNIPAAMNVELWERKVTEGGSSFEGERILPYDQDLQGSGEYVVDNEDEGFALIGEEGENKIRAFFRRLFSRAGPQPEYLTYNPMNPPGRWSPVILPDFHGRVIRSGCMIKVGEGDNRVSWTADLPESGSYDIYFYKETGSASAKGEGKEGWNPPTQEAKHFIVHHEEGREEIAFDIRQSPQGWVLLGTFRLAAGSNTIEQTDQGKGSFVTADAVKWVKTN